MSKQITSTANITQTLTDPYLKAEHMTVSRLVTQAKHKVWSEPRGLEAPKFQWSEPIVLLEPVSLGLMPTAVWWTLHRPGQPFVLLDPDGDRSRERSIKSVAEKGKMLQWAKSAEPRPVKYLTTRMCPGCWGTFSFDESADAGGQPSRKGRPSLYCSDECKTADDNRARELGRGTSILLGERTKPGLVLVADLVLADKLARSADVFGQDTAELTAVEVVGLLVDEAVRAHHRITELEAKAERVADLESEVAYLRRELGYLRTEVESHRLAIESDDRWS